MLILPPGHAQSIGAPRRLSIRERRLVGVMLAVLAVLAVVLAISLSSSGPTSAAGCIYATYPGPTGAQQISECGPAARQTCATLLTPGAFTADAASVIAAECRKARLPVGG